MNIPIRIIYVSLIIFLFIGATSCRSKRGPKEYIEKNGLHSGKKPHELAAEIGSQQKGQKKAYRRQLFKSWKKKHPGEKRSANPYR